MLPVLIVHFFPFVWVLFRPLLLSRVLVSMFLLCFPFSCVFPSSIAQQLGSNSSPSRFLLAIAIMDHAQGRAFHHHLARAIMHLNHLAGLLPFFQPSIEWEDPMLDQQFRLGRPSHASRSLNTFVPFPSASNPPTMVSHGSVLSHMIVNPEPNLRPLTIACYPREEEEHHPGPDTAPRNPVPTEEHTPTLQLWTLKQQIPDQTLAWLLLLQSPESRASRAMRIPQDQHHCWMRARPIVQQ